MFGVNEVSSTENDFLENVILENKFVRREFICYLAKQHGDGIGWGVNVQRV